MRWQRTIARVQCRETRAALLASAEVSLKSVTLGAQVAELALQLVDGFLQQARFVGCCDRRRARWARQHSGRGSERVGGSGRQVSEAGRGRWERRDNGSDAATRRTWRGM